MAQALVVAAEADSPGAVERDRQRARARECGAVDGRDLRDVYALACGRVARQGCECAVRPVRADKRYNRRELFVP